VYWCWWIFAKEGWPIAHYKPNNICDGISNPSSTPKNKNDVYLGEYGSDNNPTYSYSGERFTSCNIGDPASNICDSGSFGDSSLARP
jgi:hypothetical protein